VVELEADRGQPAVAFGQEVACKEVGRDLLRQRWPRRSIGLRHRAHRAQRVAAPGGLAAGINRGDVGDDLFGPHAVGRLGRPDRFQTITRHRERRRTATSVDALAVVDQARVFRVVTRGRAGPVGKAEIAMARIHRHAKTLRVGLQQRLHALGQPFGMLRVIVRGDRKQRRLVGVRARIVTLRVAQPRPATDELARIGGDAAVAAGDLGTHAIALDVRSIPRPCDRTDHHQQTADQTGQDVTHGDPPPWAALDCRRLHPIIAYVRNRSVGTPPPKRRWSDVIRMHHAPARRRRDAS
jgi:hypothetical protein